MRRIHSRENVCVNCRLCEVHCRVAHSESGDVVKAFKKEKTPPSRVSVEEAGAVTFAAQCRNCDEPLCVYSCIAGAMTRDPATGEVLHDPERCVGCYTCILVCAKGAVVPDPERGVVAKCDLCKGRERPVCVEMCPNQALVLVEEEGR
jgi:anaerobic carbon-monoxide dehydrogenase iron sulfur subunit